MNASGLASFFFLLPLITALMAACLPAYGAEPPSRYDLTRRECAICHIGWLDAAESMEHPLEPHAWSPSRIQETLELAAADDMCYSCHDGYVLDSRHRVWEGKGHSVGRKPSKDVLIPDTMPLDTGGAVYCGTCHTPHGMGERTAELTDSLFLRLENVDSQLCTECHVKELVSPGSRNHPVNVSAKVPLPNDLHWLGGRLASDPRKIICQSCHTPHGQGPLLKPVEGDSLCRMCHADKLGPPAFLADGRALHPVGVVPKKDLSRARVNRFGARWGQGNRLSCMTCHGIHDGAGENLVRDTEPSRFCQDCHADEAARLSAGESHDLTKSGLKLGELSGGTPRETGPCRICHRAHGWARHPEGGHESISLMCLDCHREGGAAPNSSVGALSHSVGKELAGFRNGGPLKPLLWEGKKRVVCSTCHEPHGVPGLPGGRARSEEYGPAQGKPGNASLRTEEPQLCKACHLDHFTVEGTKHDLTDPAQIAKVERLIGPVKERNPCIPCHQVHHAKAAGLWFAPLPEPEEAFDMDEGSRRCLTCHGLEAFVEIREQNGHPIGRPMKTEFMPSPEDQLVLGRIAMDDAGVRDVIVCATCHLNHGRQNPDGSISLYAGKGVSGGDLCIACHRENNEIVGSPHDFRRIVEGKFRPDEGRSLKSGVCAGCHTNHDAPIEQGLLPFAPNPPQAEGNPEDAFCLHCHLDPRVTDTSFVKFYVHPSASQVWEILASRQSAKDAPKEGSAAPLGDPGRTSPEGYEALFRIKCTTCHDNHRWSVLPRKEAGLIPTTVLTSFLRGEDLAKTLCSNCHGAQALYLYRFYHQERAFRVRIPNR